MVESELANIGSKASAILEPIQRVIAGHPSIALVYLFGSQVQGNVGPLSDIDIALLLDKSDDKDAIQTDLTASVASAAGQERVDAVFMNKAPVELAYAIIAYGKLIYERAAHVRVEYEAKIMSLYSDYLPVLRAQRDDLLRGEEYETRVQRYRKALGRTERTLGALRGSEV